MPQRSVNIENTRNRRMSEKRKKRMIRNAVKISIIAVSLLLVVYIIGAIYYSRRFCPNTVIWSTDCSGMNISKAEELLQKEVDEYKLELIEYGDEKEYIDGSDISLSADVNGKLKPVLDEQKSAFWFVYLFKDSNYHIEATVYYDKDSLMSQIDSLKACDTENMVEPVDAYISYNEDKKEYYIDEGVSGSVIIRSALDEAIVNAVSELAKTLDLNEAGCYKLQERTADDEGLLEQLKLVKEYGIVEITMSFGEEKEVLDIGDISKWLISGESDALTADTDKLTEYVNNLAEKYDTYDKDRTLHTSYGFDTTVEKGDYGWKLDVAATVSKISEAISKGGKQDVEVEWEQTANAFGMEDWGDTFIEVNLTKQHLYYYKNGELVVESDFVSGTVSKARSTPTGIYSIKYKKSPAVLRGINWETPVNYWMPFFDGCGLHDATWRSSFGGTIYYYNGSHGCLNMPLKEVRTIYENIQAGIPVLVYKTEVEPVEVVPVHETPWPDGYPTAKPTATPEPTPAPTDVPVTDAPVATDVPVVTSAPTDVPVITEVPSVTELPIDDDPIMVE